MIEFHHLQHFLAVLDTGNFSAAARRLHISQPALTKSIQRMEELLGFPLFDRTPKPIPTRFGKLMGQHARIVLAGVNDLNQEVALFQGLESGSLTVGAGPLMADAIMGPAIGLLMMRFPKFHVRLHVDNYSRFPAMLRSREIDFFVADITELRNAEDMDVHVIQSQDIIWFCRPGHPLLKKLPVPMKEFLKYPLAAPEMPHWMIHQLTMASSEKNTPFKVAVVCSHYSTIKEIVAQSDCVSGAIDPKISAEIKSGRLAGVKVTGPKLKSNPGIVTLKDRVLSPAAHVLIDEIKQYVTISNKPPKPRFSGQK